MTNADLVNQLMTPFSFGPFDVALRLAAALVAGIIIGVERESHGRAAGMRTNILVCVAACVSMLISESLFRAVAEEGTTSRPDPARLAQGVLSGMGFLGAGAIIRNGNRVQGVTTAATIWFVTMIGLAYGGGLYVLGTAALAIAAFVLFVLPRIERRVKEDWYATVSVRVTMDGASDAELKRVIEGLGAKVKRAELAYDIEGNARELTFELKFKKTGVFDLSQKIIRALAAASGVRRATWV